MTDDTKQAKEEPVQATQEPAMPTGEQKTPESATVEGAVQPSAEVTPTTPTEEGLPSDVSERTRREFEKLRDDLRNERAKRVETERMFGQPNQPTPPQFFPTQQPVTQVYDPNTGLLNEQALNDIQLKAQKAEERATKAEQAIANFQIEQQSREAYIAHPELDPKSKEFDEDLNKRTRAFALDSMIHPEDYSGKSLSFKEAADLAKSNLPAKKVEEVKKEAAKEAIEQLTPKEQASLQAVGSPAARQGVETPLENLRFKTRKGDQDAIVERLSHIPVVGRG
jgi:hypothetical protein